MKKLLLSGVSVTLAALALTFLPVRGEQAVYDGVIRLHVIAASDGAEDQAVKLKVRDSVLSALGEKLEGVRDRGEAKTVVAESLSLVEAAARETLAEEGNGDPVAVTFTRERYPEREYDNFALPAGEYDSLRVTLGGGEGKNWWCILFPSFCTSLAEDAEDDFIGTGFTPDQYGTVKKGSGVKYRVRFKILELFADWF
ncbi:MAG: stage II sporulation protein R, partial [Clostridia bacterium]|nr:stage II sporulation protein R [Clostridia bacterium]